MLSNNFSGSSPSQFPELQPRVPAQMRTTTGRWSSICVIAIILVIITVAAYSPVFSCGFVNVDDGSYVVHNDTVKRGLSANGWKYAWTEIVCANWHPLTILSYELDSSLWGSGASGYHVTNLVFHTFNVLLIFAVLHQITGSIFRSAFVAAFFAVHPLHVESVAWISERKDVLSTFFLLLTLLAYARYSKRPSVARYVPVVILFALGLLAKPMLVTLPVLLLFLDYWPLCRVRIVDSVTETGRFPSTSLKFAVLEKLPLFVLSVADGIVTILAQDEATHHVKGLTFLGQLGNAASSYCWYLKKTFIPTQLMAFYPHPVDGLPATMIAISVVILFSITIWVWRHRREKPYQLFGWSWFVIALLPVIGLLQVGSQAYADRYSYIPHLGLFIFAVWEIHSLVKDSKPGRITTTIVAMTALVVCGWLTNLQADCWRNAETLWQHALTIDPHNGHAHLLLALAIRSQGNNEEVVQHMEHGFQFATEEPVSTYYYDWALALTALNRDSEAEEKLRRAIELDPDNTFALEELWKLLIRQERLEEGERIVEQMIRAYSNNAQRLSHSAKWQMAAGQIQMNIGNASRAAFFFERAVKIDPNDGLAHFNLGTAQVQLQKLNEAKSSFRRAIELVPQSALSHFRLGEILEYQNDVAGARSNFAKAVEIDPSNEEYRQRLHRLSGR